MIPYNHKTIEQKWRERWEKENPGVAKEVVGKEKSYLLVEFPYPSGAGLHVGHVRSYTAMDVIARKRRREGKNVLYPIGWDAFGLPTENYAIKTGRDPREVTKENTDTFRRQLKSLGLSFDWSREINTTDPSYYKWTQWIFLELFKKGLAYKAQTQINWCPKCKIGLANEEVVDGTCERCGNAVEKREKEQWMLKITEYAQRLYDDLDTVDYIERAKVQQRNWIGPSEGAMIDFKVVALSARNNAEQTRTDADTDDDLSAYNFVLLHGFTGSPEANFFPWLKKELERRGAKVQVPELPDSNMPTEEGQVGHVLEYCSFDENSILLGHSLGTVVALKVLEKLQKPIKGFITVGGFCDPIFKDHTRNFETTFDWGFDFEHIKKSCDFIRVLHDPNDNAVTDEQAQRLSKALSVEAQVISGKKEHFCDVKEPAILNTVLSSLSPFTFHLSPITVFTTRPDTLFGATYLVLAPEHALIAELCGTNAERYGIKNKDEVLAYVEQARKKTDIERAAEGKEKTGVELKGVTAINPATKEEIPIWIADYVLGSYGTGAIMAVPAHDERDWEFAKKFDLTVRHVVRFTSVDLENPPREGKEDVFRRIVHVVVRNKKGETLLLKWKGKAWDEAKRWPVTFLVGGIEEGEDPVGAALREVREEAGFIKLRHIQTLPVPARVRFYAAHKGVNRTADVYSVVFELEDETREAVSEEELEKHDAIFVPDSEVTKTLNIPDDLFFWKQITEPTAFAGEGMLTNSGNFDGLTSAEAKTKITEHVGGKMVTRYKLRDWVFSRQRYWGEPIPLVFCEKDGWMPVPEEALPVELPRVEKYEPTDTGESPLANIDQWVKTTCPECGGPARRETDVMPNWAGSSWYYLRYCDSTNADALASKEALSYWTPVDWYNGGMEHTTLHLLYSRFWHKFLYDIGAVPTSEPYQKRTSHGLILAEDGEKMSKSKGNVVNPDDIIDRVGADALRVYEMFMGPFDQAIAWSTDGLVGARRFLERVERLKEKVNDQQAQHDTEEINILMHKTIKKIGEDIEQLKMNTAISQLMIFTNALEKLPAVSSNQYHTLILLLAPFAPFLAEELWAETGGKDSVHEAAWPTYDEALLTQEEVTIAVQVNGKVRGVIIEMPNATEQELADAAKALPAVARAIGKISIKKTMYIRGKVINFIVGT